MEVRYVFLAAQIIVNAFPQCARSFSVDNADTRQMGEISVIEIFVEFGNRFIHRFSEQIDLGRNRGSLGKLRFSAELLYNLIPDMTVNIDQITSNKGCPLTNFILKYITSCIK